MSFRPRIIQSMTDTLCRIFGKGSQHTFAKRRCVSLRRLGCLDILAGILTILRTFCGQVCVGSTVDVKCCHILVLHSHFLQTYTSVPGRSFVSRVLILISISMF